MGGTRKCGSWRTTSNAIHKIPSTILLSVWYRASQWFSLELNMEAGQDGEQALEIHLCLPSPPTQVHATTPKFIFFNCTSRHKLWKADTLPVKLFSQCPAIINFKRMVEIKGEKIISKKFLIRSWAKRALSLPNAISTCSGIWPVWFGDTEGCNELQHTPVCVSSSHSPAQIQLESASLAKTTFHYFHVDPDSCGLAWQGESQTEWMQFVASRLQVSFRTL